jgi:N-acylneuraminate cytidylyltransferase
MSRSLAIIPARGGSKGIPGKNLRELAGKPLIAWSILAARAAERVDQVVVSTDDAAIAETARAYGADVPFVRPADLATDAAPTEPVMAHALDWYEAAGERFDTVVLLQPTSPLRRAGTIDAALTRFEAEGADSLLGVVESHHFFWRRGTDGEARALYDYRNRPRRQDIATADRNYRETGSLYISRTDAFRVSGNRLSGKIVMFEMAEEESWELDSEADFHILEALFAWSNAC